MNYGACGLGQSQGRVFDSMGEEICWMCCVYGFAMHSHHSVSMSLRLKVIHRCKVSSIKVNWMACQK